MLLHISVAPGFTPAALSSQSPATNTDPGIGPLEIGMFLGFAGLFIFVVLGQLAKAPLMVQKHPLLEESKHHQI